MLVLHTQQVNIQLISSDFEIWWTYVVKSCSATHWQDDLGQTTWLLPRLHLLLQALRYFCPP